MSYRLRRKAPSRAITVLYGRQYGYIPTRKLSKALERLRRHKLRSSSEYKQAVLSIREIIDKTFRST